MEFEVLYGGARGGGKSLCGMLWLLYDIEEPGYRALVIRRNYDDLNDWVSRVRDIYIPMGAEIIGGKEIRFPSGAVIRLGHLKDENAYTKYQGHEYHRILIEELSQIPTEESYLKLVSSCRSTNPKLKPQVFCTTNPSEIGLMRVKKRFVTVAVPGEPYTDPITGRTRIFIPAKIEDNPTLMLNDPDYVKFLDGLPEDLRKAWREGSWDVFETKGAYYTQYIAEVRKDLRICKGLYDKHLPTYKFRDIGIDDATVIVVCQFFGKEIRIIDCVYDNEKDLGYFFDVLNTKGYDTDNHYFPHDVEVREKTSARTIRKYIEDLIGKKIEVTPNIPIEDGINAVKVNFKQMWFDVEKTDKLIEALNIYRKRWDDKNLVFGKPIHDRSSDFADAFRYMAVNYDKIIRPKPGTAHRHTVKYFNPVLGAFVVKK